MNLVSEAIGVPGVTVTATRQGYSSGDRFAVEINEYELDVPRGSHGMRNADL
jgi:hypothetical protein